MREIEIKNHEILTPETVKIPGFGKVEIIPSINARADAHPGVSKYFTPKQVEQVRINLHKEIVPQNEGAEKNFGASFGFAMALLATDQNISSEKAVGLVKGWETFEERKFSYQRSIRHDMRGIGCRHVDLASKKEYEKLYGIPSGKVIEMRNYVLNNEEMIAQVSALIGGDSVAGGNRS